MMIDMPIDINVFIWTRYIQCIWWW